MNTTTPLHELALRAWERRGGELAAATRLGREFLASTQRTMVPGPSRDLSIAVALLATVPGQVAEGHVGEAEDAASHAVALCRTVGDAGWLARALRELAIVCHHTGRYADRIRTLREAIAVATGATGDAFLSCLYVDAASAEFELGRYDRSLRLLDAAEALLDPDSIGDDPTPFALIAVNRARTLRTIDRADEALVLVEHALRALPLDARHLYRAYLETEELLCQEHVGEAIDARRARALAERFRARGWSLIRDDVLRVLARAIAPVAPDAAVEAAEEAARIARAAGDDRETIESLRLLASLYRAGGSTLRSEALLREAELRTRRRKDEIARAVAVIEAFEQANAEHTPPPARRPRASGSSPFDRVVSAAVAAEGERAAAHAISIQCTELDGADVDGGAARLERAIQKATRELARESPGGTLIRVSTEADAEWCRVCFLRQRPPLPPGTLPGLRVAIAAAAQLRGITHRTDGWTTVEPIDERTDRIVLAWRRARALVRYGAVTST